MRKREREHERSGVQLFSRRETANKLGIRSRTLDLYTARGELRAVRIGRRVLYDEADLRDFVEARRQQVVVGVAQ